MSSHIERDPPRHGPVEVWREVEIREADAVALRVNDALKKTFGGRTLTGATFAGVMGNIQTIVDDAVPPGTFMMVAGKIAEVGPSEVILVDASKGRIDVRMNFRPLDNLAALALRIEV